MGRSDKIHSVFVEKDERDNERRRRTSDLGKIRIESIILMVVAAPLLVNHSMNCWFCDETGEYLLVKT